MAASESSSYLMFCFIGWNLCSCQQAQSPYCLTTPEGSTNAAVVASKVVPVLRPCIHARPDELLWLMVALLAVMAVLMVAALVVAM